MPNQCMYPLLSERVELRFSVSLSHKREVEIFRVVVSFDKRKVMALGLYCCVIDDSRKMIRFIRINIHSQFKEVPCQVS